MPVQRINLPSTTCIFAPEKPFVRMSGVKAQASRVHRTPVTRIFFSKPMDDLLMLSVINLQRHPSPCVKANTVHIRCRHQQLILPLLPLSPRSSFNFDSLSHERTSPAFEAKIRVRIVCCSCVLSQAHWGNIVDNPGWCPCYSCSGTRYRSLARSTAVDNHRELVMCRCRKSCK